jgi:hypothetical protein
MHRQTHIHASQQVDKGLIQIGSVQFELPIKGVGQQSVLFADSRLRIFQSGNPGSDWETEGLVVVQIPETALNGL